MDKKIESWKKKKKKDDAWKGEINVTFNQEDLKILASALNAAEYEGAISLEERDYLFNKLNIYIS